MSKTAWTPWHEVVQVREDLKSGDLPLATFAADLYDVIMGRARPVYQEPGEFFALTYPTFNLRELTKDVILRLAGKNDKAVRQLVLTYGGGKTHALITLFHLVNDPAHLPDLPAVHEFTQHIGHTPPQARVAVIAFDRLDPETGMDVLAPDGSTRRFKYPWSVLAYQLGGDEGLHILGSADGPERESPPFTNVLEDLFRLSPREGLSTLVLIDEVLMWARTMAGIDPVWRHRLQDFFQCLTQAATKVDSCAVVASILATDPRKSDALGKEIARELFAIFRREQEEAVEPVLKEDVAEILRRRFFTPESIRDREAFRPHVVAAIQGIAALDEQTAKEKKAVEERFLRGYPFHPDLTEVFYSKWTNLEGFQRTRGVLRTFALALRDAEKWDKSPLVAANVFLNHPERAGISEAARELTTVAATEEYEGRRQEWTGILEGELTKARDIQEDYPGLDHREIEQAVFATFLHSQPIGQKASTRELMLLLGHTRPDKIELEKALRRWVDISWFLDEEAFQEIEAKPGTPREAKLTLPRYWRLGSKPNLRQMHHDACQNRVPPELVETSLIEAITKRKSLTEGASAAGATVHNLPKRPADIKDDGEFHYAVLGPDAASGAGKPSTVAKRFIDETTTPDRPRVYRNAVVLAVPSRDGLAAARSAVLSYLGWEEVRADLQRQDLEDMDPIRWQMLLGYLARDRDKIVDTIRQAYSIVVTVSEKNDIEAFKVKVADAPLFETIKNDKRSRIQDTPINAEALLPGGPYDLWVAGETSRRVKDLVGAFAQFPHLPKMLNRQAILDTLVNGCLEGNFVLRLTRPDKSTKTFWRQTPDDVFLQEPGLEVVLLEAATLTELAPPLLVPEKLPGLWESPEIPLDHLYAYFSGSHIVKVPREGYEEAVLIPEAERGAIDRAVEEAVEEGLLWLISGPVSVWSEEMPAGLLTEDAVLQGPPDPISPLDLLPKRLPEAWVGGITTALRIEQALSLKEGKPLPWEIVQDAIEQALRRRLLERAPDSGPWPCDYADAQQVKLRVPSVPSPPPPVVEEDLWVAEAELEPYQIQDLADVIGEVVKAAAGYDLKFRVRIELGGDPMPGEDVAGKAIEILKDVSDDLEMAKTQ